MDYLLKLNGELMSAPAGILVALFAIALGYLLKTTDAFPNNKIPLVIVGFTTVIFPVLQWFSDKLTERLLANAIIGFILGFIAWLFHAQILRRWVDPIFFKDGESPPDQTTTPTNPGAPKTPDKKAD